MGDVVRIVNPIKCGIAFQGGAALCAFNAGAAAFLLSHLDVLQPLFITGTSAGGLNALKTTEALSGGAPVEQSLLNLWRSMAIFQQKSLSTLHYGAVSLSNHTKQALALDAWHQATLESCQRLDGLWHRESQLITDSYRGLATFMSQSVAFFLETVSKPQRTKPLLQFLTDYPLDFAAINASSIECTINASRFDGSHSIWALPTQHETLFSSRMAGGLDVRHALASGSLHHMMPPEMIDGHAYHDGGYLANPNLMDIATKCNKEGAVLFVLRTRPTQAYRLSEELAGTAGWASAFFNKILDDDMRHIIRQFPYLKICVIEPEHLERGLIHGLTPEMQFGQETVDRRFSEGNCIAQKMLSNFLERHYPLHQQMLQTPPHSRRRRRNPPALQVAAS